MSGERKVHADDFGNGIDIWGRSHESFMQCIRFIFDGMGDAIDDDVLAYYGLI